MIEVVGSELMTPRLEEMVDAFRALVSTCVARMDPSKGDDAALDVQICWPSFLASDGRVVYRLTLYIFRKGPVSDYEWEAEDPLMLFRQAMADVKRWITELDGDAA